MSKRSKKKKNKAQGRKEPLELSEKPRPDGSQPEEPQPEESQPKEPKPEDPQPKKPQLEEPQTEESQPEHNGDKNDPTPARETAGKKKRQQIIMIVMITLAVIMVIVTAIVLLHNRWVKKPMLPPSPIQSDNGSIPSPTVPSIDPGAEGTPDILTMQPLAGGERKSKDFFTVLIFGSDEISGLTDTIMVASYDVTNQKATVLSIPRDTLINNYYLDKANKSINAAYKQNGKGEQGAAALKTEVSRLIGFVPDFYVTIDWELVGQMVDAIDGVEFNVPWRMKYDDPHQNLHINLMPGLQTLNGEQAMQLVRWRKNNKNVRGGGDGSDLSRLNVQHDFLKAVLKQTLQPQNIVRIPELIRLFNENVASDLAVENMLWFGEQAVIGGLSADDVEFVTMPVYGTTNDNARYYGKVCPIINQLLKIVNNSLNPYVEDVTLDHLDLIQMSTDGNILSSTTGTLRNPAAGIFTYPDDPEDTDPAESDPVPSGPAESDPVPPGPAESDPVPSGPAESDPVPPGPVESDTVPSGPAESDPVPPGPVESDTGPTDPVDDPPPETGPALPDGET